MRKIFAILVILFWSSLSWGVGNEGFVLNMMRSDSIMKEISGQVTLPFYTEYRLKLKNTNDVRAVAKVTIDGIQISNLGDFVVPANGEIVLERFLDQSLVEGKKFKFVPLNHPEVDDPYSKENGRVRVEFRLEKTWPKIYKMQPELIPFSSKDMDLGNPITWESATSSTFTTGSIAGFGNTSVNVSATCASAGATIAGGYSNQKFTEVYFETEEKITRLELKIIGI